MARVQQRYDLTYSQEQAIASYIKGEIKGSEAARRLTLPHRQSFVNMLASIIQQWHHEGRLVLVMNGTKHNKK